MKGVKKNAPNRRYGSSDGDSRRNVRWINVNLDVSDKEVLAQTDANPAELSGVVCGFVLDGGQFGLKFMDRDGSYMAYFIGRPSEGDGEACGLSAFADNPLDSILCLCYKFGVKLSGELPLPGSLPESGTSRFR